MNTITAKEFDNLISSNRKDLAYKLMKSEFFTPIRIDSHSTVISTVSDDENVFMRLFASLNDYEEMETDIEAKKVPFEMIFNFLKDKIDGFIVYVGSKEFVLDDSFIKRNILPYTAEELKDINDNVSVDDVALTDRIFLTLLLSEEDYSDRASNGIIRDEGGLYFEMATTELDGNYYHLLFTSKDHLKNAFELFPESHYYSQIIDLAQLIRNFREDDISGVLIDFPDGLQFISTEELQKLGIRENVKLRDSLNYMFEAEQ